MSTNRGFVPVIIGIVVLVAIVVGGIIYQSVKKPATVPATNQIPVSWKTYHNDKYGFEIQYPIKGYAMDETKRESADFDSIVSVYVSPPPIEFGANFSVAVKSVGSAVNLQQFAKNLYGTSFISSESIKVNNITWLKVRTKDDYFEKEISANYFTQQGNKLYRINFFPLGSSNRNDFVKMISSFKFIPTTPQSPTINPSITVTGISIPGGSLYPASRVPFLHFTIKATSGDVTIDSLIIQKKGTLRTSALTKIVLIDNDNSIELAEGTFNQYDSSSIIKPIKIKAGETKNFWLHSWIASDLLTSDENKYATLAISAINTSDWQNVQVLGNWQVTSEAMVANLLKDTTPVPVLNSINPSAGTIGTEFTLYGQNLNGFEGTTYVTFENQNGQKGVMGVNSYAPQGVNALKFVLPSSMCTVSVGESGKPCPSYLVITPGSYKIYAQPWGKQSNHLNLIITP